MGRKSKLTEKQWEEIGRRLLAGEKGRALGKEFGVSEAAIRGRFSAINAEIKVVANQLLATEAAIKSLPISAQIAVYNFADDLRAINQHMAGAARFGAATAHRLSGIAHDQVSKIDDAEPERSLEAIQRVGVLTKMANEAANIPMNLLNAHKDFVKESSIQQRPQAERIMVEVIDASAEEDADA